MGFLASVTYRGVDWIFVPTTLLSQGDSCIGSKTSINFGEFKNQMGTFYPPKEIVIDTRFLNTIGERERRSGIGEMLHYFLLGGSDTYSTFKRLHGSALKGDEQALRDIIVRSLEIKKSFIEKDEFENGTRKLLNYGHTFGHAIETMTAFSIPHGIAVAHGMNISNFVSHKLGMIDEAHYNEVKGIIKNIAGTEQIRGFSLDTYISALKKDKKNTQRGINVVLSSGFGEMSLKEMSANGILVEILQEYFERENL